MQNGPGTNLITTQHVWLINHPNSLNITSAVSRKAHLGEGSAIMSFATLKGGLVTTGHLDEFCIVPLNKGVTAAQRLATRASIYDPLLFKTNLKQLF